MYSFNCVKFAVLVGALSGVFCAPYEKERSSRAAGDDNVIDAKNECNCVCGVSNRQMRVVGGNITKVHEFPWLVGLYSKREGKFYCGASLVTRKHLLTAAHCIDGMDINDVSAALADYDREASNRFQTLVIRGLKNVKTHESFDAFSFNNDVAILELDEPVDFDATIQPACLPTIVGEYEGRLAIVAGWGKTGERQETSPILRKAAVPVWSKEDCYNAGYGKKRLSENMFCAGYPEGEKDACQGDSGGPLHMVTDDGDMEVIGVVSWGRGCARPNLPGIYTKLGNYLDWINEALDGECLCPRPQRITRRA